MIKLVDLLQVRRLGLRLIACEGSESVWIRWAQPVDDLLDMPRLSGGELVVTSGRWSRSAADAERFVYALVNRGATALAIEQPQAGRTLGELVTACERWRLPLVVIDGNTPAATVAETAITMVIDRRSAQTLDATEHVSELVQLLGTPGLPAMLSVLGRHLGGSCWLLRTGSVVAADGIPELPAEALHAILETVAADSGSGPVALPDRPDTAVVRLDRRHGSRPGHVLVCSGLAPERAEETREAIDRALPFLERQCAMVSWTRASRRATAAEFLRRLMSGDASNDELGAWVRALGVDPRGHVACVTARGQNVDAGGRERMVEGLEDLADCLALPRIVVDHEDEASVFLFAGDAGSGTETVITRSCAVLSAQLRDLELTLGTSSVIASDIRDVVSTLHNARRVCELNALRNAQPQPPERADPSLAAFLLIGDPKARAALHASLLEPLLVYDRKHGSDLVRTLDVFLSSTGQWSTSAAELGVHVNTLRYRLARIGEFTGRDLGCMADRVDFYVALRALEASSAESDVRGFVATLG